MVDDHAGPSAAKYSASVIAERLREILDMLDHSDVTPDIGAHVDLALCRLVDQIAANDSGPDSLSGFTDHPSFS
jgi:hypothetical protein